MLTRFSFQTSVEAHLAEQSAPHKKGEEGLVHRLILTEFDGILFAKKMVLTWRISSA